MSSFGGLLVEYTYTPGDTNAVRLTTDISASRFDVDEIPSAVSLLLGSVALAGKTYSYITLLFGSSTEIDISTYKICEGSSVDPITVGIFFFNNYISVSYNKKFVYWYGFGRIEYPSSVEAKLKNVSGASITLTNIRRRELFDGRVAIFVDYEADSSSVIGSLLQQRPIQTFPLSDGKMNFTYQQSEDIVDAVYVNEAIREDVENNSYSSDGLTYFRDVDISISEDTARDVGFVTRLYKLSELDSGAIQAVQTMQRVGLERRKQASVGQRLDPRIDQNDVLHVDTTVVGTGRLVQFDIVVDSINIRLENGNYSMRMSGREVNV
jgi:hypothetical protein